MNVSPPRSSHIGDLAADVKPIQPNKKRPDIPALAIPGNTSSSSASSFYPEEPALNSPRQIHSARIVPRSRAYDVSNTGSMTPNPHQFPRNTQQTSSSQTNFKLFQEDRAKSRLKDLFLHQTRPSEPGFSMSPPSAEKKKIWPFWKGNQESALSPVRRVSSQDQVSRANPHPDAQRVDQSTPRVSRCSGNISNSSEETEAPNPLMSPRAARACKYSELKKEESAQSFNTSASPGKFSRYYNSTHQSPAPLNPLRFREQLPELRAEYEKFKLEMAEQQRGSSPGSPDLQKEPTPKPRDL